MLDIWEEQEKVFEETQDKRYCTRLFLNYTHLTFPEVEGKSLSNNAKRYKHYCDTFITKQPSFTPYHTSGDIGISVSEWLDIWKKQEETNNTVEPKVDVLSDCLSEKDFITSEGNDGNSLQRTYLRLLNEFKTPSPAFICVTDYPNLSRRELKKLWLTMWKAKEKRFLAESNKGKSKSNRKQREVTFRRTKAEIAAGLSIEAAKLRRSK
jgi:hypothetical protein